MENASSKRTTLSPIIKWAGGKESELDIIHRYAPESFDTFYEPFVGGGSVFMSFNAKSYKINDFSKELINLYQCIREKNLTFYNWLKLIETDWKNVLSFSETEKTLFTLYIDFRNNLQTDKQIKDFINSYISEKKDTLDKLLSKQFSWHRDVFMKEIKINLSRKILRMKKIETEKNVMPDEDVVENISTAFLSSLYMYFRKLYNDLDLMKNTEFSTAIFYFIRNYCYSGMFRYNSKGEFNVPYGGIAYNHKFFDSKIKYFQEKEVLEHFKNTEIYNLDFEKFFLQTKPDKNDFVFLDPPYDSEFSTYANNDFSREDQKRLCTYLTEQCKAQWLMIIKNTSFIYSLYQDKGLNISSFSKNYKVSFMNRNDKNVEHLIIRNY